MGVAAIPGASAVHENKVDLSLEKANLTRYRGRRIMWLWRSPSIQYKAIIAPMFTICRFSFPYVGGVSVLK